MPDLEFRSFSNIRKRFWDDPRLIRMTLASLVAGTLIGVVGGSMLGAALGAMVVAMLLKSPPIYESLRLRMLERERQTQKMASRLT